MTPDLDPPVDLASNPCTTCRKRWILEMDDSGVCPRCMTYNDITNPTEAIPWNEEAMA